MIVMSSPGPSWYDFCNRNGIHGSFWHKFLGTNFLNRSQGFFDGTDNPSWVRVRYCSSQLFFNYKGNMFEGSSSSGSSGVFLLQVIFHTLPL